MTQTTKKYLKDYTVASYLVDYLHLNFDIQTDNVIVTSEAKYIKNKSSLAKNTLLLNGSSTLKEVKINNQTTTSYTLENDLLTLENLDDEFTLTITTIVDPFNNKSCMGLYESNKNLFTQNEPEGFRKITYYQDRSDVLTKFTTTIIADKTDYPILLSNGNKVTEEKLAHNRHLVTWEDPFKKPSYLFALVAGKFALISDTYTTKSGKNVLLEIYSEETSINQCNHAMESLKRSMKWDEDRFNLEYDLNHYMIVASGDFNMGAMENKGLNIFNTKYVLADTKTATDTDFINVEAVVGHEYFHNWTGNRITCRDWFQLSLKEGLTVFRDQEFTSDMHSRDVKRIQDVKVLRQLQFSEDASPLSHPVRPDSFIEINNFYTVTIYEKGSEVVRMYQTILGKAGFNKGMKLYVERHDGQAATCEDFCNAMADANNIDLTQFMLWYSQAGTPTLAITDSYDSTNQIYTINIQQKLRDKQQPMLIPLAFGLLDEHGKECEIHPTQGNVIKPDNTYLMLVSESESTFKFKVAIKPTPSLLRGFSAPVIIDYKYTDEQIYNLAGHDSDSFNRWEALQYIYEQQIMHVYEQPNHKISSSLVSALTNLLSKTTNIDPSMLSMLVTLPAFTEISSKHKPINPHQLINAITNVKNQLANNLEAIWLKVYQDNQTTEYNFNDSGKRALKNTALSYLLNSNNSDSYLEVVALQFMQTDNMTDKVGALVAVNDSNHSELRNNLLESFYNEYKEYPLVMDKWFMLQAQSLRNDTQETVMSLVENPSFDNQNPNKIYSLIRAFGNNNKSFNTAQGYQFIAQEIIRIDKFNPSVAGRVAGCFSIITSLTREYQELAQESLKQILSTPDLSQDVYEIISKISEQL